MVDHGDRRKFAKPNHYLRISDISGVHDEIVSVKSIAKLSIIGLPPLFRMELTFPRENAHIALCPNGRLRRWLLDDDITLSRSQDRTLADDDFS